MSAAAEQTSTPQVRLETLVVSGRTFARAACAPAPETTIEEAQEEPVVAPKTGKLAIGASSVLWHYSRLLDRRLLHPALRAPSRAEAIVAVWNEWAWFLETCTIMGRLFDDTKTEVERTSAEEVAAKYMLRGAELAGDVGGQELGFAASTFESARVLAVSLAALSDEKLLGQDVALQATYAGCCQLYSLGRLLLRVAPLVDDRSGPGLALAMELTRYGALHGYAAVREAWEIRRSPEDAGAIGLLPVDDADYALALSH